MNNELTIVTGIWDLNREEAGDGFKRPFSHYIENFKKLLQVDAPMVIFIDEEHENLIWEHRNRDNTAVYFKNTNHFREYFEFYDKIQEIRTDPEWYQQAAWLTESAQATMDLYNPVVMSKMFMLNDARVFNPFNSDYFIWLDGGITNTVHPGYFTHDKVLDKLTQYLDKFLFLCFPYDSSAPEIHGFTREGIREWVPLRDGKEVEYVARGGIFGGSAKAIEKMNGLYWSFLSGTLQKGYMGTEESVFTILSYRYPEEINRVMIHADGLVNIFFENLKNDSVEIISTTPPNNAARETDRSLIDINETKTSLYIVTFNFPDQLQFLLDSFERHEGFLKQTRNILLDNSTDPKVDDRYKQICEKYNFEHVKKDNIGICGGRQWIAEHFHESDSTHMLFFEDDFILNTPEQAVPFTLCPNGFAKFVPNLYSIIHKIILKENFDFLKLNFTEFFGDNKTQWAWYNVPQSVREEHWPEKPSLPEIGFDDNPPKTIFHNIGNVDGLSYANGEIYYCNWPQLVSKSGNQKMFIDTKWGHPYEQTWMSHIFQLTLTNDITPGILLASPFTHERHHHYDGKLRREN
jgi:hypothetical protein